ncbi:pilus assembly protein FlpD [Vibrio tarriae]|uniref:pilus assembly protein FlpD n=1 Tax=Vibrio tarriae TaxID=2014742 RepID=UPI000DE52BE7|nr:pilus assembly protein FlpD [Vibrio tarriae]QEO44654.1 pilus assembly protein FlpD [Vibrio cholerae]RBM28830.1 pilus assembly protein FlpD [Vibrio tarriae]RBM31964.1 pilus assembly protein FlpD [Vibrio tarriae]RBM67317.1 pilus assembly protein FlpD [Vibrio tarriae]
MKFSQKILLGLAAIGMSGCQTADQPHSTYQQSLSFETHTQHLQSDLNQWLAPLKKREEQGTLQLILRGGQLNQQQVKALEHQLFVDLLLPVELDYQPGSSEHIRGDMKVVLTPKTCRFSPQTQSVSTQRCQLMRNHYFSTVQPETWLQGEQYQEESSALATGAVQRLFNNQAKSAEKQPVTGEQ